MSGPVEAEAAAAPLQAAGEMGWGDALVLGLVEGLTEYLPVSSTGHLLITQRLLGLPESEAANAYAVAIQAGAILAVLGLYRTRVLDMVQGILGRSPEGRRLALHLVLAFVPAAIAGLTLDDPIERLLFGHWPIVAAWAAGGLLILALASRIKQRPGAELASLGPKTALIIGLCQCAALWPGVSRSLACLLGGLLVGLSLPAAVEFSFLLGLITLGAATGYKSLKAGPIMIEAYGWGPILLGALAAWLSAVLSVKWMVGWLNTRGLQIFGYWRLAAALLVAGLALSGRF
jgi:undecaprenyl-diphosphatase